MTTNNNFNNGGLTMEPTGVKETDCTNCIHREVCALKTEYLNIYKKLPDVHNNFEINVKCRNKETRSTTKSFFYRPFDDLYSNI